MTDEEMTIVQEALAGWDIGRYTGSDREHEYRVAFRRCLEQGWIEQREWQILGTDAGLRAMRSAIRSREEQAR